MALALGDEDKRKEAMDFFIRALHAAPDSLVKSQTGKSYAQQVIDGAIAFKNYLFPSGNSETKE